MKDNNPKQDYDLPKNRFHKFVLKVAQMDTTAERDAAGGTLFDREAKLALEGLVHEARVLAEGIPNVSSVLRIPLIINTRRSASEDKT